MSPLVTTAQLAKLREDMAHGFTTTATIKRPIATSDELGDDAITLAAVGTVSGWLSSSPTPEPTLDGGIVTANTYRWDCPVGTDIRPRDRLTIGAKTYVVTDTNDGETLAISLSCTLRLRE